MPLRQDILKDHERNRLARMPPLLLLLLLAPRELQKSAGETDASARPHRPKLVHSRDSPIRKSVHWAIWAREARSLAAALAQWTGGKTSQRLAAAQARQPGAYNGPAGPQETSIKRAPLS